jgi:hypothetical protein
LEALGQAFHLLADVRPDVLAFAAQLDQGLEILERPRDLGFFRDVLLQTLALTKKLLAMLGPVPEIGIRDLLFDLGQAGFLAGDVKDSPAQLQPAGGAPRIPFRVLRAQS